MPEAQMAMFVHLTLEALARRIRRNGISRLRKGVGSSPKGVFAVPVTRNFYASHQWVRELKRRNRGPLAGVYFRVPDKERVWVGHYGQVHRWMSAAEAAALFATADDPLGWEVVIPRRIEASEIHRTRRPASNWMAILSESQRKATVLHLQILYARRIWRCQAPQAPGLSRRRISHKWGRPWLTT